MRDVVVIGAGLAGLTAALRLARAGRSVTLVARGVGGLSLAQGTIDILGYTPERVLRPLDAVAAVPPEHPYAGLGPDAVAAAVTWLRDELGSELLVGDPAVNLHLPTALGALRPTALAQPSMVAADARGGLTYAVVGVRQLKDFPADLVAGNLARSTAPDGGPLGATAAWVDLPARPGEADPSGLTYARSLDDAAFADRFAVAVRDAAGAGDVVLLPGVLGVRPGAGRRLAELIGRPVAEVPLLPPSVPGLRLADALRARVAAAGVRILLGSAVTGFTADGDRVATVTVAAAGGPRALAASDFVYAPGGFESGALAVDSRGAIAETVFGLPLTAADAAGLVGPRYWAPHPLFEVGVRTDAAGRPVAGDKVVHPNLYVAGGILAGPEPWREKSGDGIAVATAVRAAAMIEGGAR
nr:glycerol-3-phosphate dehydrogenase subunit GlpB [Propionibacterium sp.]